MGNETQTCDERELTHMRSGGDQSRSLVFWVRGKVVDQLSSPSISYAGLKVKISEFCYFHSFL